MHWFVLQLLRAHHLGWKIRRPSGLTNLLNLSEVWAQHIWNSLSLNKKGNTIPGIPTNSFSALLASPGTHLKPGWSLQSKQYANQKFNFKTSSSKRKNTFTSLGKHAKSQDCSAVSWPQELNKLCEADSAQSLDQITSSKERTTVYMALNFSKHCTREWHR